MQRGRIIPLEQELQNSRVGPLSPLKKSCAKEGLGAFSSRDSAVCRCLFCLGYIAYNAILIGVYVLSLKVWQGILFMRNSPATSNTLAGKLQLSVKKSQVLFSVIAPSCIHLVGCMQALLLKLRDLFSLLHRVWGREHLTHECLSGTMLRRSGLLWWVLDRLWDVSCLLDAQAVNMPPQVFSKDYFSLSVT